MKCSGAAVAGVCLAGANLLAGDPPSTGVFRAGMARKVITPNGSIWMSGFAARKKPSEGVLHDLWAKALALEDAGGRRVVIVTTDLIGLPHEVSAEVAERVKRKYGLDRRQLLLSSSHTHSGPAIWPNLHVLFELNADDQRRLIEYRDRLVENLVEVVGSAMADLSPATLGVGHGSASFAANRRKPTEQGYVISPNPAGPVDQDVPVLKIAAADGRTRAVLFGYACHNTSLVADCLHINGDYAGFAQIELEKAMPGTTAMFMILCGADQNAAPRGTRELSSRYGKALADEVARVATTASKPVANPTLSSVYEEVKLDLVHQDRSVYEQEMKGSDVYRARRARNVLAAIDAGRQSWDIPIPMHAIRFGEGVVLLALGGEVVVDYSLRLKREYTGTDLIVAGYCNEVPCYVPSRRVLAEGGYEPVDSMIYYGQPGPFKPSVEETLVAACHRILAGIGVKYVP